MTRTTKTLLIVLCVLFFVGMATTLVIAATVINAGVAWVRVEEHGPGGARVYLPVPMALLEAGMAFGPLDELHQELAEVRHTYGPMLVAAAGAIADAPDFTLVEVQDRHDWVKIAKQDDRLDIRVDSRDATVHVSVPVEAVERTIEALFD
jgi:hypothetical protein